MPSRRVLIVTYQYPPMPFLGGDPWSALAKHLGRLGHEVSVLTTSAFGGLPDDDERRVDRSPDLTASPALRRVLRRPALAAEGAAVPAQKAAPALLTKVVVPDVYLLSWAARAAARARRLVRRRGIECVVTTSPPESTHLIGLALGRTRPAWIADLRDGWTFEPLGDPFPLAVQRRCNAWLERLVVARADGVTAATRPLAADLRDRLGARDATFVPNAWDPDLEPEVARAAPPPALDDGRVSLVYTGTLGGVRIHDDRGLFEALRVVGREQPEIARRIELVVAGRLTEDEQRTLQAPELAPFVRLVGALPRPSALALQRRADALLLVTSNYRYIATGKIFEYFAARRPILALAGDNEAAALVRETGSGDVVAPDDVPAIVAALGRVADGELARAYRPRDLDRYNYAVSAAALAERIGAAIDRRGRHSLYPQGAT